MKHLPHRHKDPSSHVKTPVLPGKRGEGKKQAGLGSSLPIIQQKPALKMDFCLQAPDRKTPEGESLVKHLSVKLQRPCEPQWQGLFFSQEKPCHFK